MTYRLGVDLGSTWTTAAIVQTDGFPVDAVPVHFPDVGPALPSILLADADGSILVGAAAASRAAEEPGRAIDDVLLRLGDPTPVQLGGAGHNATDLLARLLSSVVTTVTEQRGARPDEVVVARPASWGPYRRERFAEVPAIAGVHRARIAVAAELAAARYGRLADVRDGSVALVCHFGGRTFECSLVQQIAGTWTLLGDADGVERLGGDDLDAALLRHLDDRTHGALEDLLSQGGTGRAVHADIRRRVRAARETLSNAPSTVVDLPLPGNSRQELLTRADLEALAEPLLVPALAAIRRTLDGAGVEAHEVTACLLTGGASSTPVLSRLLDQELGRPVHLPARPGLEVALAAAELTAAGAPHARSGSTGQDDALPLDLAPFPEFVVGGAGNEPQGWTEQPSDDDLDDDFDDEAAVPASAPAGASAGGSARSEAAGTGGSSGGGTSPGGAWDWLDESSPTPPADEARTPTPQPPRRNAREGGGRRAPSRRTLIAAGGGLLGIGALALLIEQLSGRSGEPVAQPSQTSTSSPSPTSEPTQSANPDTSSEIVASSDTPAVQKGRGSFGDRVEAVALANGTLYGFVSARASRLVFMLLSAVGTESARFPIDGEPQYLTVTPDGSTLCITVRRDGGGRVVLVDVASQSVVATVDVGDQPNRPGMAPDGTTLYVPCRGGNVIWAVDIAAQTSRQLTAVNDVPQQVAISADGRRGYVPERASQSVAVLDLTNGTFFFRWAARSNPVSAATSPDGQRIYVANGDNSLSVVDTGGQELGAVSLSGTPSQVVVAPDGRHVYVVIPAAGVVDVVATETLTVTSSMRTAAEPFDLAVSADGSSAWIACAGSGDLNIANLTA